MSTTGPLSGRRVVVTRAEDQAGSFADRLRVLGAEPVMAPLIAIVAPSDGGESLTRALGRTRDYDWLVLTSPNGVERVLDALAGDVAALGATRVAVVGPGTAARLEAHGRRPDLVPERAVAEGLLDAFDATVDGPASILLAQAAGARAVLVDGLRARGHRVDTVEAYRTEATPLTDEAAHAIVAADAITFTSASTVRSYVAAGGLDWVPPVVACIGPITAATARELGLEVTFHADPHTLDGLIAGLLAHFGDGPQT